MRVVVADSNLPAARSVVHEISSLGGIASACAVDVSDTAAVRAMIVHALDTFGNVDAAVNNAGIAPSGKPLTHEITEIEWDRMIAVNLTGVFLCMRHELEVMLRQGSGSIVNTSSVAGLVGSSAAGAAYAASKHGIIGLTRTAALDYATRGIRVNAVCPGPVMTPMARKEMDDDPAVATFYQSATPMARLGEPEEVAAAIAWLCSDSSSYVTGHTLSVDGGYVAR
jgi:NAD(P)-dependent dehydrogenase (short-subunit alcohol dehydrogenase family)